MANISAKNFGICLALGLLGTICWSYLAPSPRAASLIARGDVRLIQEKFPEAQAYYVQAQQLTPQDFRLFQRLGRVHQGLGETDKAQELFRKALELSPSHLETQLLLGDSLLRSEQGEAAESVVREVLASHPECLEALIQMGWARELQADLEASERWYQKASELHPNYFEAEYQLGQIDLQAGRNEQALEHLAHTFGVASGWDELALEASLLAWIRLDRPQEAEDKLRELKLKGGHPSESLAKSYFNLGVYFAIKGDPLRARGHLEEALFFRESGEIADRAREVLGKLPR